MYISLIDIGARQLIFNWSPAATLDCPDVHYNILSSNCGSCPTTTTHTTVTCTDVPTDSGMCMIAVQTVVCGNITDEGWSYPLEINITDSETLVNVDTHLSKGQLYIHGSKPESLFLSHRYSYCWCSFATCSCDHNFYILSFTNKKTTAE